MHPVEENKPVSALLKSIDQKQKVKCESISISTNQGLSYSIDHSFRAGELFKDMD